MDIIVTKIKLKELCEAAQVQNLSNDKVTKTVFHQKIEYVITGTVSSGALGWIQCDGYRCLNKQQYKGKLEPLNYARHGYEVDRGKRGRGYNGQLANYGNRCIVLYGDRIVFKASGSDEGKQETLF